MADVIFAPGVHIAETDLEFRSARASGPGGQNVNKVETKVELRIDPAAIVGLDEGALVRLRALAGHRLLPDGRIAIVAQASRHQFANKQGAIEKLQALVVACLVPPKPRRATRPSRSSQERRIASKKKEGDKKRDRGRIDRE